MTTVAIIQARMSSSRFPGKHLAPLAGKPMIDHVMHACRSIPVDKVIVATSKERADEVLVDYCARKDWDVFRGSLGNPLERTWHAAMDAGCDLVLRITADLPLLDWRLARQVLSKIQRDSKLDYVGQTNSPDGTDVEVFKFSALNAAAWNAGADERQHTTTWIRANMNCESAEADPRYADVHYSVNTVEDLRLCEQILAITGEGARWQDHVEAYRKIKAQ